MNLLLLSNFGLFICRSCKDLSTSASLITASTESVSSPALSLMGGWLLLLPFLGLSPWVPEEGKWRLELHDCSVLYGGAPGHSPACTHFAFLSWTVFLEIVSEKSRYSLHQNMDKIKVPTQIIWGKQDQVCRGPLGRLCQSHWPLRKSKRPFTKGA